MPVSPLLIVVLWIGSFVAGWSHWFLWLPVPPIIILVSLLFANSKARAHMRSIGIRKADNFQSSMIRLTFFAVGWNVVLHAIIFGVGYLVGGVFT